MYAAVKEVSPLDNYTLSVTFDSGETGVLHLEPFLDFGVFRKLKDREAFTRVRVAFDTIEWECGVDLDPQFLYRHALMGSTGTLPGAPAGSATGE